MHYSECRHCGRSRVALKPRGLCWSCYENINVRRLYPKDDRYRTRTGSAVCVGILKTPPPTKAAPGSDRKMHVLQRRAALGYMMHHPQDEQERGGVFVRVSVGFLRRLGIGLRTVGAA